MTISTPTAVTLRDDLLSQEVNGGFRDLAPSIHRQRMVVEGYPTFVITDEHITDYLRKLSDVTDMITIIDPVTHVSELYGWAGWIHWETSGAHFYSWERPVSFFSVDIYTCKAFDPDVAVAFTREFFSAGTIVAKSF
jgi:S-adenosylmethionine decarboxylase